MKHIKNIKEYNKMKQIKENSGEVKKDFNTRSILSMLRGIGFLPKGRKSGQSGITYSPDKSYIYGPGYIRLCGIKDKKEAENLKKELSKFGEIKSILSIFSIDGEAWQPKDFHWLKTNNIDVTSQEFLETERFELVLLDTSKSV